MHNEAHNADIETIFVTWEPFSTRSHNQALHFGAKEIYIYPLGGRPALWRTGVRYFLSALMTISTLSRVRASIVFCLNQPPPLIVVVFVLSKIIRFSYVLDSHAAAFNDPKWAWFLPMYRTIAKHALLNINTSRRHQELVTAWGGKSVIISDVPIDFDIRSLSKMDSIQPNSIAVVTSFMFDEPIEEIFAAAALTPEVTYYMTGDAGRLPKHLDSARPENVVLTGFLPREDYLSLLVSTDAVMVLTTRDHTMQRGGYEALSLERPIITSDWEVLRESFGNGAVYVNNTETGIAAGIKKMLAQLPDYVAAIAAQRVERRKHFEGARMEVLEAIRSACESP